MLKPRSALVPGILLAVAAAAAADTITFVDGRKPEGKVEVVDETVEKVEYRRTGLRQNQSYPADKVAEVTYTEPPEDYTIAMENMENMAFEDAAKLFRTAAENSGGRRGLEAKCLFLAGEALRRAGQIEEALTAYSDLVDRQPDSRYAPHARLQRGITLARAGDANRAQQVLDKLKSEATAKGYGQRWVFEAELQLLILGEAANPTAAREAYERLVTQTEASFPTVANQAKLRIGRVLIASKEYDKARQYFQTILENRSASGREIVAGAFNGLGAALRNKPGATEQDLKQSLYNHLRVCVSYSDVIEEQPEALYSAAKCFQKIPGPDSADRAALLLRRCVVDHPDSPWAKLAQKG
ncbi:MAG: tetratricopeptide repeat protein [Planctomycetes bacterium]|nr:tetratricopeptide repeat protein [Planctomycetota bacterium]